MGKSLSLDIRERVVALVREVLSCHEIARRVRISAASAVRIMPRPKRIGGVRAASQAGLPRRSKLDAASDGLKTRIKTEPDITNLFPNAFGKHLNRNIRGGTFGRRSPLNGGQFCIPIHRQPVVSQIWACAGRLEGTRKLDSVSAAVRDRLEPNRDGIFQTQSASTALEGADFQCPVPIRCTGLRTLPTARVPKPLQGCRIPCRVKGRCLGYRHHDPHEQGNFIDLLCGTQNIPGLPADLAVRDQAAGGCCYDSNDDQPRIAAK